MKKQNKFLHSTSIAFILLGTLFCWPGCKQGNAQDNAHQIAAKKATPAIDIHTAIVTGNIAVLKQHITAGSNLNEKDPIGGSSPLITACLFGKSEMAKLLMDAGADLNFQNNDGSTPLHTAAFFCRPEIVQLLLTKGANKTIKNKYSQTAYETVAGEFAKVKPVYETIGKMLAPMGFKLDNAYLEKNAATDRGNAQIIQLTLVNKTTAMNRRYDIDCLRVIAIGLLLVYHTAIAFQPWGFMLGFITNDKPWESLWIPMGMINVWRIPLLFFISGMGVYFAMQQRNWKQLLLDRAKRILIPFVFGIFCIVPVQVFIAQRHYLQPTEYIPNPAHLWFLGNIFLYVLLLLPVFYWLVKHEKGKFVGWIRKVLSNPLSMLIITAAFISETLLVNPILYELYAMTWHGFFIGFLAFFVGFCFMLGGTRFWKMLLKWRWLFLMIAISCYVYRLMQVQMKVPNFALAIESNSWIFSIFAFGYKYLNRRGKLLHYLSSAAYPIYIIHMIFLYLGSFLLFPLNVGVYAKFALVLIFTVAGCFATYEFVIRRINFIRIVFGLKALVKSSNKKINTASAELGENHVHIDSIVPGT